MAKITKKKKGTVLTPVLIPEVEPPRKVRHAGGRPPTPMARKAEIIEVICKEIATGKGLSTTLATLPNMPDYTTVMQWIDASDEFTQKYARARADQADFMADEIVRIADEEPDPQKARVRVDARKWVAAHLKPKKWGERAEVNLTINPLTELLGELSGSALPLKS